MDAKEIAAKLIHDAQNVDKSQKDSLWLDVRLEQRIADALAAAGREALAESLTLRAVVEKVEWQYERPDDADTMYCPWCYANDGDNFEHKPDCARQLALAASPLAASAGAVLAAAVEAYAGPDEESIKAFFVLADAVKAYRALLAASAAGEPHTPMVGSNPTSAARGVGEPAG